MKKDNFEIIMAALENRKASCSSYLKDIQSTADLSTVTLARAAELKKFCIEEENIMTNIVMVDLYHVIGMGELSPVQMMQFTYSIKEYLEYRPVIKAIVKNLDSIMSLPKIPVKTKYKLQGLGGLVLTKGEGPVVDETTAADLSTDLPFSLDGSIIKVNKAKLESFISIMSTLFKTSFSIEKFKQKSSELKEYAGIQWKEVTESELIGTFKSNELRTKITSYYNKRKMDM